MIKYYGSILVLMLMALNSQGFAQTKKESLADSTNTTLLANYKRNFPELEKRRIEDSMRIVILREQADLKSGNATEKKLLLKQIDQLEREVSEREQLEKVKSDSLRQNAKAYPVIGFFNDTLFSIYTRLGSFSARERAEAISKRVNQLGSRYGFTPDSLRLNDNGSSTELSYGETILVSISDEDGIWNNARRQDIGLQYKNTIAKAILKYQQETSASTLLKEIGLALLLILVLTAIVFFTFKIFRWTSFKIRQQEGKGIRSFALKDYTLLDSQKLTRAFLVANTFAKWIVILILVYISLPILFGIFPWTHGLADTLLSYFVNPIKKIALSVFNYLPNLITIIVIVVVFKYVIRLARYLKNEIQQENLKIHGFYPDWAMPTFQIVRVLLYAFMFTVIFPYLPGSDSPVFKGVSVFLGVLFTFGSSGSLSNIMSGLVLTYMRSYKIGDRVKIGEITGDIIEKTLLVTRVRTIKNEIISVPNSNVMSSHTINYSSDATKKGLIVHTTVTIGYDVPWKQMQAVLIEAALRTEHILDTPAPFVLQTSLEDFYVAYQINGYTREPGKQALIYSQLHQNIQDSCNEAGIEIMSPHYRAGRDGNQTTIPPGYLKNSME